MSHFRNQPTMHSEDGEQKIKRYVHSRLTTEHNGVNATITENGRVILSKVAKVIDKDTVEVDEIEIPASLVFKLAQLLKATRQIKFISLSDLSKEAGKSTSAEENEG